jgi:hypothetical protein
LLIFSTVFEDFESDSENYLKLKEDKIIKYVAPYEYKRVCYFANWAAKRRSPISKCTPEDVGNFTKTNFIMLIYDKIS